MIGLAVLLLGILIIGLTPANEPSYQGRKLSEWLMLWRNSWGGVGIGDGHRAECEEALGNIGTNAIPTLLRFLAAHDSDLKSRLIKIVNNQKIADLRLLPAGEKHLLAATGFSFLGTNALPAMPALIELTNHKNSAIRIQALRSLVLIMPGNPKLLPVLTNLLHDADTAVRNDVAINLSAYYPYEAERLGVRKNIPQFDRAAVSKFLTDSATNATRVTK